MYKEHNFISVVYNACAQYHILDEDFEQTGCGWGQAAEERTHNSLPSRLGPVHTLEWLRGYMLSWFTGALVMPPSPGVGL